MSKTIFRSACVFDGESTELRDNVDVLVADGTIRQIDDKRLCTDGADVVDCVGRFLMPGLIDAHVHVYASSMNLGFAGQSPMSYLAHFAARFLRASLDRGFTTVRDVGGADVGLALAVKEGLLESPRLFYGGRFISQTGGHGDFRPGDHDLQDVHLCGCAGHANALAVIADGADAVRQAIREELRRGASHIKIMASGGVVSPTDPLERCQYSDQEICAAVDEATRFGSYVAAHCHPAEAIGRAARLGVRSIEHGTLIDPETAALVAARGAFVVPTMAGPFAGLEVGERLGLSAVSMEKLRLVVGRSLSGLEIMKAAGVKMGFGTDLIGSLFPRQGSEFTLRARVLPTIDILRSACCVNAELLGQVGLLGCVREGAMADLLVVDGDPLEDISLLDGAGEHLLAIMKAGQFYKRLI